jgi:hypothetical protein
MIQFDHINEIKTKYPSIWDLAEQSYLLKGKRERFDWEDEIFIPICAWSQLLFLKEIYEDKIENPYDTDPKKLSDVEKVAAVGAWRMTQGIYHFDDTLAAELIKTDRKSAFSIPPDVLLRLPEWCIYLDLSNVVDPAIGEDGQTAYIYHGAYVHIDRSIVKDEGFDLRFLWDVEVNGPSTKGRTLFGTPIFLNFETLEESLDHYCSGLGKYKNVKRDPEMVRIFSAALSLLIYICSESVEYDGNLRPQNPKPFKTKKGIRFFQAHKPTKWNIGFKTGALIREQLERATESYVDEDGVTRSRPRAHIRRAHFHGYWTGPRNSVRSYIVKWIPPTLVNASGPDDIIPTVHRVEGPSHLART